MRSNWSVQPILLVRLLEKKAQVTEPWLTGTGLHYLKTKNQDACLPFSLDLLLATKVALGVPRFPGNLSQKASHSGVERARQLVLQSQWLWSSKTDSWNVASTSTPCRPVGVLHLHLSAGMKEPLLPGLSTGRSCVSLPRFPRSAKLSSTCVAGGYLLFSLGRMHPKPGPPCQEKHILDPRRGDGNPCTSPTLCVRLTCLCDLPL